MRGLLKAAVLLAPALATSLSIKRDEESPSAFIRLDVPHAEDDSVKLETTLRLSVLESEESCGQANVTINGQALSQDSDGLGSGSITTEQGSLLIANWKFACVNLDEVHQEQLLELHVDFIDGKEVQDVGFTVQFQQKGSVWVSSIEGADSVIKAPKLDFFPEGSKDDGFNPDLEAELSQLRSMKLQLVELEQAIFMKERFLAEAFGFQGKPSKMTDCDNLKCVFMSMYDSVKGVAGKFYGHGMSEDDFFGGRHGGHHRGPHGFGKGKHHGFPGFPHHGNHTHGNHTFPPPPHGKPHFPPPECHCPPPPPPPPHHGPSHEPPHEPPHGPPHGPPDGPHGPPHDGPEGHQGPPHHGPGKDEKKHGKKPHDGEKGPGSDHHHGPPPPPPHDEFEDRPGHPGRPGDDSLPPPPPPPFDGPGKPPGHPDADGPPPPPHSGDHEGGPGGDFHHPPPFEGDGPDSPERPEHPLQMTEGERPPPPEGDHEPPHGHEGDHPPHGHGGPHRHGPPPAFDLHHAIPALRIGAIVVTLGLLFAALHTRCFTARREDSRQSCLSRRRQRRVARRAGLAGLVQRVRDAFGNRDVDDEEKEAMLRRIGDDENDSDAMSTTMEQDIEQFRNAANVVSDMVAAEEGRSARAEMVQYSTTIPVPPSPHTAFADYMSIDEALPAYDEAQSNDSTYVSDGMRFSPGSSTYAPSVSSAHSSLDENLGRKE